ncbi:MAG TPA: hypothetical protein PLX97_02065 [Gemmatales bacterium]|nr:hypothetical protein [Gemmatales bacterium]
MNRVLQIEQLLAQAASEVVIRKTALDTWHMPPRMFERDLRRAKHRYARRACHLDIIAELMISYEVTCHRIHVMAMEKDESKKNASFHNAMRHLILQRISILKDIAHFRDAEDRNAFKDKERTADREKELDRYKHVHFTSMDSELRTGRYYDAEVGVTRNSFELNPNLIAERDAARMRILPKSPREDAILAEFLDTIVEPRDHFDPDKVDDTKRPTDIGTLNPYEFSDFHGCKYSRNNEPLYHMARKIWLERLKHYNDTWCAAEKHITGVMDLFGIKLHVLHDSVGIPEPIKRALAGDTEAIADLKASVQAFRRGEVKPRKVNLPHPMPKPVLDLNADMLPLHEVERVAREFYEKKEAAQKEALARHGYIPDELLAHPQFNIDVTRTGYHPDEQVDTTLPKMPWDAAPTPPGNDPVRPGAGSCEDSTSNPGSRGQRTNDTPPSTLLQTVTTITTALLLAFTLCWTMFALTVGIHHLPSIMRAGGVSPLSQVPFQPLTTLHDSETNTDLSTSDDASKAPDPAEAQGAHAPRSPTVAPRSLHAPISPMDAPHSPTENLRSPPEGSPPVFSLFSSLSGV